jgi:hypothetical protein
MTTKTKNQTTRKSKANNHQICVLTRFSQGNQNLRGYFTLTNVETLRKVCKSSKPLDSAGQEILLNTLVESLKNRNLLSRVADVEDSKYALVPKDNEIFQEYFDLIQRYMCCFNSVDTYLEENRYRHSSIIISIDIMDASKTNILGFIYKDGCYEKQLEYQLN